MVGTILLVAYESCLQRAILDNFVFLLFIA